MLEDINIFGLRDTRLYDILAGIIAAAIFIGFTIITGFSIGIPLYGNTLVGKFLFAVLLAPIFEEILFRVIVAFLFSFNTLFMWISSALSFAVFHWYAYGASLSAANASYIGAFVFGILALIMLIYIKANLVGSFIFHALVNLYVFQATLVIFGGL